MRRVLIINSVSGGAQLVIGTLLLFITVPIFINKLGIERYGIFSLIMVISNLSFFLNLGLNTSLIKFLSEQGKTTESDIDIFVANMALLFSFLPFAAIAIFFNEFIASSILNIPEKYITEDTLSFYNFLVISNLFQFVGQISVTILDSLQRIYLTNLYQVLYQIIYWGFILASIFFFGNLEMIGLGILISTLLWYVVLLFSVNKYWGRLNLSNLKNNFTASLKKQVSLSYKLYVSNLINFFYEPFTKILISSFIGINEVGYFDIILKVRTQIWNLISKLLYPLFPYLSKLKDLQVIRNLIHDIEQKLTYIILLFIAITILIIPDFVQIWLKTDLEVISTGMIFVIAGNLVGIIVMPLYQFLVLKGYPGKTIILQALNVIVNIIIFILLYSNYGFWAVIAGNVCAILSSFALSIYFQKKYLNSLIFDNMGQVLKAISLFFIIFISGYSIDIFMSDITEILILPPVLCLITFFSIRLLKLVTVEDIIRYSGSNLKVKSILIKIFIISVEG